MFPMIDSVFFAMVVVKFRVSDDARWLPNLQGTEAVSPTAAAHGGGNPPGFPSFDDDDDAQQPQQPDRPEDHQPGGWNPGGGDDRTSGLWGGSVSLPNLGMPAVGGLDEAVAGRARAHRGPGGE